MGHHITVLPNKQNMVVSAGSNLLEVLRCAQLIEDAPCGGNGTCGKCRVLVDGVECLACQTTVDRDMTVFVPKKADETILSQGFSVETPPSAKGLGLAFDIGTTTVVGYLLKDGRELANESCSNPQAPYGADVVTRIRMALMGCAKPMTDSIRKCVSELSRSLCGKSRIDPKDIATVSIVGNPAMQQLFLGISVENLARIPFSPVLTKAQRIPAAPYLPTCENAELLIVPDISGYVGADTVACVLATGMHESDELTLLVDIGTNGEMVLGNRHGLVACSTAAGPALEGANISFGMRGQTGAIDHVRLENGTFSCSVIGNTAAKGICGSGLIDAVAAALDAGLLNSRGKVLTEDGCLHLTENILLTQEDIRQVQLAKGAIAAGIRLMADRLGVSLNTIQKVYLAGAFGTFMNPSSACRIGLLPDVLEEKIEAAGNVAGSGAKLLCSDPSAPESTEAIVRQVEFLELASVPEFRRCFAKEMCFAESPEYWRNKALDLGFTEALPLDIATLQPRADVREMCAADKCRAYGKNWTCPPHCGTLEECGDQIHLCSRGILLQTVGKTEKAIDTKAYKRTEQRHLELFYRYSELVRARFPGALCLGSGGCRICGSCAWPDPCRFPEKACPSMEGYGLFVTQVCRDNDALYHHGDGTITYTACVLFP